MKKFRTCAITLALLAYGAMAAAADRQRDRKSVV